MHAEINVRFTISIDDDKTQPLATLAESLTELDLEAAILDETITYLDR